MFGKVQVPSGSSCYARVGAEQQRIGEVSLYMNDEWLELAGPGVGLGADLLETMPHGVVFHDAAGKVRSANPAALQILGITMKRLRSAAGRRELFPLREDGSPWRWEELPTVLALQTGEPQRDVAMQVYNQREKRHRLLNVTAMPLFRGEASRPTHGYTLFEDITKRKEAERRQQENQLSLMLRGSNDGFWDWSKEKNQMVFSQRWWDMLGYAADETADGPDLWYRMIHPEDQRRVGQLLGAALQGEVDSFEVQYRLIHKAGHCLHVVSRIFILRDQKGEVARVCGTNIDLTERLQMEENLRQYQNRLELANETLEQRVLERTEELQSVIREQEAFSYSVSHDLRAPLRHINSFSAIVLEEYGVDLPDEGRAYLQRICAASSKMGALIDDLLELSRVARTAINLEPVPLSEFAVQILQRYQETEPHRVVSSSVVMGITVLGDRVLLRQLLENLLGNAWKYTTEEASARIEFGVTRIAGAEAFFVKDNGVGFDMGYKEKLFRAFERLHGSEFPGTGVGLATAERIVKRHGGSIWAEGKVGDGATFYFTLPVYY